MIISQCQEHCKQSQPAGLDCLGTSAGATLAIMIWLHANLPLQIAVGLDLFSPWVFFCDLKDKHISLRENIMACSNVRVGWVFFCYYLDLHKAEHPQARCRILLHPDTNQTDYSQCKEQKTKLLIQVVTDN